MKVSICIIIWGMIPSNHLALAQSKTTLKKEGYFLVEYNDSLCPRFDFSEHGISRLPYIINFGRMIDTNLYKQGIWADIPVVNTIHTDFYDTVYTKLHYTTEVKIPFLCDWDEAVIKDDFLNYKKIHMEIEYEFVDTIEVKVPDFIKKKGVFRVKCPRYNINKMTVLELSR